MTGSDNGSKFLWGAASSAFQVEGHPHAGGRGRSKWDVYTHEYRITEAVVGVQHDADVAINAYDRSQSLADIAIMRDAGLDAYRFSISWPRILPEGTGAANQLGIDHYSRFVDDLLAAGIKPLATLYHWDFPWALHQKGGWHNRDVAGWFSDYATTVFRALGDRVDTFVTINEPQIDLFMMDLIAAKVRDGAADPWAWSSADIAGQAPAMHNLLRANAAAVAAYRSLGLPGMIGNRPAALSDDPPEPEPAGGCRRRAVAGWIDEPLAARRRLPRHLSGRCHRGAAETQSDVRAGRCRSHGDCGSARRFSGRQLLLASDRRIRRSLSARPSLGQ